MNELNCKELKILAVILENYAIPVQAKAQDISESDYTQYLKLNDELITIHSIIRKLQLPVSEEFQRTR